MSVKARVKTERKRVTLPIVTRGFMELNECSRRTAQVRTDCRVVFFYTEEHSRSSNEFVSVVTFRHLTRPAVYKSTQLMDHMHHAMLMDGI